MKNILFSMIFVAAMVACTKDTEKKYSEFSIKAQTSNTVNTKTVLESSNVIWRVNDELAVFGSDDVASKFVNTSTENSENAIFRGSLPTNTSDIVAIYPFSSVGAKTLNSVSINLPEVQNYYSQTSFGELYNLSWAKGKVSESLTFKNLCAVLKIQLIGNVEISKITFESNGAKLAGYGSVDLDQNTASFLVKSDIDRVELTNINLKLNSEISTFYLVVAAGTYSNFKLTVEDVFGVKNIRTSSKAIELKPSVITSIQEFKVFPTYHNQPFTEEDWTWQTAEL